MMSAARVKRSLYRVIESVLESVRKSSIALRRKASAGLLRYGARFRRPSVVAFGLHLGTRARSHHLGWKVSGPGRQLEILAFKNSGLVSDLDAAFSHSSDVRLSFIPGGLWRRIAREFLTPPLGDLTQAHHREARPGEHARLVEFLVEVCERYFARRPFDVVIAGNFTHWVTYDLGHALQVVGKPFLILHKEGLVSAWPSVAEDYASSVRAGVGATTASDVLVHSAATGRLLAECGIAAAERIRVVGTIRLDACHAHRQERSALPPQRWNRITFFTFWPHVGIHLDDDHARRNGRGDRGDWSETLRSVLAVAETVARSRPDLEVAVKSKASVSRLASVAPLLRALQDRAPANLHVISKNEGQDLILYSDAIVALNSTVLLEAIAAGVPAVVPCFRRNSRAWMEASLLDLDGAAQSSESAEDLVHKLLSIYDVEPASPALSLSPLERRALSRYSGNADGSASRRLRQAIDDAVGARP